MTGRPLSEWRSEGALVSVPVGGRSLTVFRRLAGRPGGEIWTLLHGWPTTSWDWAAIAPELERSHRTLALDWPGLGASATGDGVDHTIDGFADAVAALWQHDDVTATRIVAHDVGTVVAQELLARDLEGALNVEIASVTWLNGPLYPDLGEAPGWRGALLERASNSATTTTVDVDLFRAGLIAAHHPAHQPSPETLDQHWVAFGGVDDAPAVPRSLRPIHRWVERADRFVEAMETTTVPQRFIWGDRDPISGRAQSSRIQDRFGPGADLVSIDDCAHYPHVEHPRDVAREMLRPWGPSPWSPRRSEDLATDAVPA